MNVAMSLRGRGAIGSAKRAVRVLSRFGATASAMSRRLDHYERITSALGVRPTWPTTACVLARHPALLGNLEPLMSARESAARPGTTELHLIAGPLPDAAAVSRLCTALLSAGARCQPAVFDGQRLALH